MALREASAGRLHGWISDLKVLKFGADIFSLASAFEQASLGGYAESVGASSGAGRIGALAAGPAAPPGVESPAGDSGAAADERGGAASGANGHRGASGLKVARERLPARAEGHIFRTYLNFRLGSRTRRIKMIWLRLSDL